MGEMQATSDAQLLRDYAAYSDEAAFRELVTRHTDFVYSAALRQVYSPDLAGDLTQSVFSDLARKAHIAGVKHAAHQFAGWLASPQHALCSAQPFARHSPSARE
jgi:DNA-directed RNA polymerase specialized sigma24 family protein